MIEQNPVLKALNLGGQSQGTTESADERQLLPKLNGSFAEVLNHAAGTAMVDSENRSHLGAAFASDIQVDTENLAKHAGVMVASLATDETGLPQAVLSEEASTDLDMVMQQIHLPQDAKLPTLPSNATKAIASAQAMMDASRNHANTEKAPGLAEIMDSEVVETADESMERIAEKVHVSTVTKTDTKEEVVNLASAGAQTAGDSVLASMSPLEKSGESSWDATDSTPMTVSENEMDLVNVSLNEKQAASLNVDDAPNMKEAVDGVMAPEKVTEVAADNAKAPEVLNSLRTDTDTATTELDDAAEGLTKESARAEGLTASQPGTGDNDLQTQKTMSETASNNPMASQSAVDTNSKELVKEAAQDKDRAAMTSQTHAAQPKADGNVGKEMTEAKSHKPDSGNTNAGQSNTASSQSNQQGQQSFSGQQQQAQQQFMNQVQKQVVQTQQEAVKNANEASVAEAEKAEKAEKVLGNLGLGMDAKKTAGQSFSIGHPVRSPQWGQALGQKVTYMANNKIQEAKITLNPEKLGPIQVKLSLDKDQHAHVSMVTQHGTTRDAIENAMPRLKEMLEAAGVGFGSLDVRDESSSSEQSFANQDDQLSSGGHASGLLTDADDADIAEGAVQTVSSDNLVDFYA
ncbi:MAG: flagellar hook-length control protein FliK [Hydrogenovibrio sp.]|jgi:flagellar hook-length control protein FliK